MIRLLKHPKLRFLSLNSHSQLADPHRLSPNGPWRNRRICRTLTSACLPRCLKTDLKPQLVELSAWWAATLVFTEQICNVAQRKVSLSASKFKRRASFARSPCSWAFPGTSEHSNHEVTAQGSFFCEEFAQATTCTQTFTQTLQVP